MITCKTCKKFAKFTKLVMRPFDEKIKDIYGSCKNCGYTDEPNRIDYDDFEELMIDYK